MELIKDILLNIGASVVEEYKKAQLSKQKPQSEEGGVFLFFSFDLSDSKIFKTEHPDLWASVFSCFYNQILKRLTAENFKLKDGENSDSVCVGKLWKLIEDEVLIYIEVSKLKQLYSQIISINNILKNLMSDIAENVIKDICGEKDEKLKEDIKEIILSTLGIKVAAWVAECYRKNNFSCSNIIYSPSENAANEGCVDFLGRDIDEGFRMAKYAVKNKIIVSPLLAWLIWKKAQEDEDSKKIIDLNFKITAFISMKGVWRGRKVPVIMFNQQFLQLVDILEYDELELDTFANVKRVGYREFAKDERFEVKRIDGILENVHRKKEAEQTYKKLSRISNETDVEKSSKMISNKQELHLACMIFDREGRILIHKDSDRGYEFGCIKKVLITDRGDWKECCEQGYMKKYGIKIKVDRCPIPIATYLYDQKNALGLIIMAEYDGEAEDIKEDWFIKSEKEIMEIDGKMVELFKENVKNAVQIRKLRKEEKSYDSVGRSAENI